MREDVRGVLEALLEFLIFLNFGETLQRIIILFDYFIILISVCSHVREDGPSLDSQLFRPLSVLACHSVLHNLIESH